MFSFNMARGDPTSMRTAFVQRAATLLMVALIGMSMGGTSVSSAQTPIPEPPQPPSTQIMVAASEAPTTPAEVEPSVTSGPAVNTVLATPETLIENNPIESLYPAETRATASSIIDISTPNGVTAGDIITYTYTFTNTISSNGFYVQAWWLNYSPYSNGNLQYCDDKQTPKSCDAIPETAYQLPSKTPLTITHQGCPNGVTPASSTCYLVAGLPLSGKGQFQIRMRARVDTYPKTNENITPLSGSAKLLPTNSTTGQGEDTASTLVVGPVLSATKTAVTTGKIYTGDEGTFKISVGNAIGVNDKSTDGTIRADARTATNILVTDVVPIGSTFVSSNQSTYQQPYDPTKDTEIKWLFPGPLKPGATLPDIQVVFKKVGGTTADCDRLNNGTVRLTSKEYPIINGATTIISFGGANIPVVVPLQIKSIQAPLIAFGDTGDIVITVQNYKTTAVNNVTLSYQIQTGVSFVQATPKESSIDTTDPAKITWNFNIPAGSMNSPKEMSFTIKVNAGYSTSTNGGAATLTAANQPLDCNVMGGRAGIIERLTIRKGTTETYSNPGNVYIIENPTDFSYYIELTNGGTTAVSNLEVVDKIPQGENPFVGTGSFSYVPNSAKNDMTGQPLSPIEVTSQIIRWQNLQVDPGSTLRIKYTLHANGYNYVNYCNSASAVIYHDGKDNEIVRYGGTVVCLRLQPPFSFEKTVDKSIIAMDDGGNTPESTRTVKYTLKVTNNGKSAYPFGFVDNMDSRLIYVPNSTEANQSFNGGDPTISVEGGRTFLTWESKFNGGVVPSIPAGATYTLSFRAIVPEGCNNGANINYDNLLNFRDDHMLRIVISPEARATVIANCGKVETSVAASPNPISLANTQDFVVMLRNTSKTNTETNLPIEVRLPSGYSYVGISTDSAITTAPTTSISNTFVTLKWTLPSLGKDGTSDGVKQIRFKGKAGLTLLPDTLEDGVWARTTRNGKCPAACMADPEGGIAWSAAPVRVDALITLSSKFTQVGCAEVNSTRTYELTVSNTNVNLDYTSTIISATLPLGLTYIGTNGTTSTPIITTFDGKQTLVWKNQTIGKKVGAATTKLYSINLKVTGQGGGALTVNATATSPVGAFPPRTGVVDPTVFICMSKPGLWFTSAPVSALPGQTAIFEIQATNPMSSSYALGFEYTIPSQLEYITTTADLDNTTYVAPKINGNVLSWPSVTLPAAANTSSYGQMVIHFKLKLKENAVLGTKITNKLKVTKNVANESSMPLVEIKNDTTYLFVMRSFYLPIALR